MRIARLVLSVALLPASSAYALGPVAHLRTAKPSFCAHGRPAVAMSSRGFDMSEAMDKVSAWIAGVCLGCVAALWHLRCAHLCTDPVYDRLVCEMPAVQG